MTKRYRFTGIALLALLIAAFVVAPLGASAAKKDPVPQSVTVPVTSSVTTDTTGLLTNATFTLTRFTSSGGQLAAVGTLTGTVTDLAGNVIGTINQQITLPVTTADGSCQILHLELGPLDLDLLGLQVHLDRVVLDITAQSGPGNLLGNLLCAIAGLLDANAPANQLANLLNQLLSLLG
jgi:hypothetical protein